MDSDEKFLSQKRGSSVNLFYARLIHTDASNFKDWNVTGLHTHMHAHGDAWKWFEQLTTHFLPGK